MKPSVRALLWGLLLAAAVTPSAQAALSWPWSDNAKTRHTARTFHATVQHPVRPVGNASKRVVKPVTGARPIGKTILAKRPP
ncbi:MAG TPA: hypothetical protein VGH84_00365 [Steroidobacteraceae bacterium]|jgi:hypothetical protein